MSPVVHRIAARYRESLAGRTGSGRRDLVFVFKDLLADAGCGHGVEKFEAVRDLETLHRDGVLILERHRRDHDAILKVRLPLGNAALLFEKLGEAAPESGRELLSRLFVEASGVPVPIVWAQGWKEFCLEKARAALNGESLQPFDRNNSRQTMQIVSALPKILDWEGESFLRFASAAIFQNSKVLETLRGRIEKCLNAITAGRAPGLAHFGIIDNDRSLLVHGPLSFHFDGQALDIGCLHRPIRFSMTDLRRATLATSATRCLTVENAAMLHELAKRTSGVILASSGSEGGFANAAVMEFLQMLPGFIEVQHFGDSDPKGFDILSDLRARSGRKIQSFHMRFRPSPGGACSLTDVDRKTIERLLASSWLTAEEKASLQSMVANDEKGVFEQEALGVPGSAWPFYPASLGFPIVDC